jgi:hypothetical protein
MIIKPRRCLIASVLLIRVDEVSCDLRPPAERVPDETVGRDLILAMHATVRSNECSAREHQTATHECHLFGRTTCVRQVPRPEDNRYAVLHAHDWRSCRHDVVAASSGSAAHSLGSAETAAGTAAAVTTGVVTAALSVAEGCRLVGGVVRIEVVETRTAVAREAVLLTALRTKRVRVVGVALRESSVWDRKAEAEDQSRGQAESYNRPQRRPTPCL